MTINKNSIYIIIFSTVIIANIFVLINIFMKKPFMEHFTTNDEDTEKSLLKSFIFKLFDEHKQRNPSNEELEKYMEMKDKDLIEKHIKNSDKPVEVSEYVDKTEDNKSVIEEETKNTDKDQTMMQKSVENTMKVIDTISSNVTFSKSFITTKINSIQQQLDDIKLLL